MAQHHHVDVLVREARVGQRIQQDVPVLDDAVALAQLRFEERADAGLEQHGLAVHRRRQQGPAGQFDAIDVVGRRPLLPHRPRRIAEHRAAVQALRVSEYRPQFHA